MDTVQFADGSSLIMGGFRGGTGGRDPLENHKNIVSFSNTGPDPVENLNTCMKPAIHDGPSWVASITPFK